MTTNVLAQQQHCWRHLSVLDAQFYPVTTRDLDRPTSGREGHDGLVSLVSVSGPALVVCHGNQNTVDHLVEVVTEELFNPTRQKDLASTHQVKNNSGEKTI